MLSPETWNLLPPIHKTVLDIKSFGDSLEDVSNHYFNHSVTVILPETILVPEDLNFALAFDNIYYKVDELSVKELLNKDFIFNFVSAGRLTALSLNTRIDTDNCAAVTPSGYLVLNLLKETYQTLGLEGKQSQFSTERYGKHPKDYARITCPLLKRIFPVTMPQKHQVESLELLALKAIGEWVKMVGRALGEPVYAVTKRDPTYGLLFLQQRLDYIRETLYATVPWYLSDKMAVQVLTAVKELINETKGSYNNFAPIAEFLNQMKIAVHLTEAVMHPHLKQLTVSDWPKIMRHVLNQNLSKLVGLEKLDLGSGSAGWDTSEAEKFILSGVQWMPKLTTFILCFDCTNGIISVLSSCPMLQKLDVTSSRSVTDRCIPSLLNCKRLREVQLFNTSLTAEGYAQLLTGLPTIEDLGRCDEFGKVLKMLEDVKSQPLQIKSLRCKDLTLDQLKLLVKYCPRVSSFSLFHDERISDLTVLSALQNLKKLKLMNCDFFTDCVKELLEKRGKDLECLHLEHVDEIDLNALIYISQYCPILKKLVLYNCEFAANNLLNFNLKQLAVPPFSQLEKLVCVCDCLLEHLEFLMMYCEKIQHIQLGSSTGITDGTMFRIFAHNPMRHLEELRILYSHNLSLQTVNLLMCNCDNLRTISELESWEGLTQEQLVTFRQYIRDNNINLDTRPTLSY